MQFELLLPKKLLHHGLLKLEIFTLFRALSQLNYVTRLKIFLRSLHSISGSLSIKSFGGNQIGNDIQNFRKQERDIKFDS